MVVAGGGVAGATTAIALARRGVPSIVLERSTPGDRRLVVGECLAPSAAVSLAELGLWNAFEQEGHRPSHANVSRWAGTDPTVHNFLLDPHGCGWFIDRARFDAWLLASAEQHGATVHRGIHVAGCKRVEGGIAIDVRSGTRHSTLVTDVVVDATGPTARIARQLGAVRFDHDRMIAWTLRLGAAQRDAECEEVLLVEPTPDGWWYAASPPGDDVVAVFVSDPTTRLHGEDAWRAHLDRAVSIRARCTGRELVAPPRPHSLVVGRLDRCSGPGWLAVGDAALSRDPLAAVGMTSALEGGIAAAAAIADGCVDTYGRDLDTAFEEHLDVRATFYRAQTRWPESQFWRRRAVVLDEPITLHPSTRLATLTPLPREIPLELGTQLCPWQWRRLLAVDGSLLAADLARWIAPAHDRHAGDHRVIAALQRMVQSGVLRAV
ncbi:MAG: tryptophan 7-halogenase [Deltaproteobacteria bacterium]|nr:tryptophan 7-halogenase [Nannocystaceae bacterium]